MADTVRPSIRLRPNEQRSILLIGDLLASIGAVFGALFFWYQYQLYKLVQSGMTQARAEKLIQFDAPPWFFLLPLAWLILMVELYDSHNAAHWGRTWRGIATAAFIGLLGYSLLFTIRVDPESLPRIGVGAFLCIETEHHL